jgi:hypothetical protein
MSHKLILEITKKNNFMKDGINLVDRNNKYENKILREKTNYGENC